MQNLNPSGNFAGHDPQTEFRFYKVLDDLFDLNISQHLGEHWPASQTELNQVLPEFPAPCEIVPRVSVASRDYQVQAAYNRRRRSHAE